MSSEEDRSSEGERSKDREEQRGRKDGIDQVLKLSQLTNDI